MHGNHTFNDFFSGHTPALFGDDGRNRAAGGNPDLPFFFHMPCSLSSCKCLLSPVSYRSVAERGGCLPLPRRFEKKRKVSTVGREKKLSKMNAFAHYMGGLP